MNNYEVLMAFIISAILTMIYILIYDLTVKRWLRVDLLLGIIIAFIALFGSLKLI